MTRIKSTTKSANNNLGLTKGYILCLEYVGDRRASIIRNTQFEGYSPCDFGCEFQHEVSYITNQEKEDELVP